ncbi:MAG: DNA replication/repair protein RecF [Actinomycetota bacterium]
MQLERVELVDFRNYHQESAELGPGVTLVTGRNGQGKTNLLEAVHVLCGLGSHRSAGVEPLVRVGAERAVLRGRGISHGRQVRAEAEIRHGAGIRLLVNRVPLQRYRVAGAGPSAVLFSPEDLMLIKGGPEQRRRFLDQGAARLRPLVTVQRLEFERVLRQRNGVLKAASTSRRALATLEVWDESFVRSGAEVVGSRLRYLRRLAPSVARHYEEVSGGGEQPNLLYRPSWEEGETSLVDDREIERALATAVGRARSRDLERGASTCGPHRDDLGTALAGLDARVFASQGEQRSLALALRLAEWELESEAGGEEPILLLDDVFSELDEQRRGHLVALVESAGQTIATITSSGYWPASASRKLKVEAGRIVSG